MGAEFVEHWPETRTVLGELSDDTGIDLGRLCLNADFEELERTDRAQPALFALGVAVWEGLRRRLEARPAAMAGHSLGHWTALAAAGGVDYPTGLQLVQQRARSMTSAVDGGDAGGMVAVLGPDPDLVAQWCQDVDGLDIGAVNTPTQTVITGRDEALEQGRAAIESRANRVRFRSLDVAIAFHSRLMTPAKADIADSLSEVVLTRARIPIVSDVKPTSYRDPATARTRLAEQTNTPIDWPGVMDVFRNLGIERILVIPPAGAIPTLCERNGSEFDVIPVTGPETLPV